MSRAYTTERIRFIHDSGSSEDAKDVLTGATPDMWRGMNIQFEYIGTYANAFISMIDISTITMEVKDVDALEGNPLMMRSVSGAGLNTALNEDEADEDGTDQHCVFRFSGAETLLDLKGGKAKTFWIFIWATTTTLDQDGNTVVGRAPLMKSTITMRESGATLGLAATPIIGSNLVPNGSVYDGGGLKVINVAANLIYEWVKNTNDLTLINGAETISASGRVTTQGATLTLTGTPGAPVTATVRNPLFYTAEEVRALVAGVMKAVGDKGQVWTLRSPSGLWALRVGITDDGEPFLQPIATP